MTTIGRGASGRRRLAGNAVASYAGQLTAVLVGFLLTPFILRGLGPDLFGVWALVLSIQGLAGLLDLGVTTSVVKYVAEHEARGELDMINRVVSTTVALHVGIGAIAFGLLALAAWGVLPLLNLVGPELHAARDALLVVAATVGLSLPLAVPGNLLAGLQRYAAVNSVNVAQAVVTGAATLIALANGAGPAELVAIGGVGLIAASVVKWWLAARALPGLRVRPGLADRATLRRIGGYSVWLFLIDTAKRIFYNADAVLIAAFLPVGAVGTYNLGFKPASATSYASGPLVSIFLPVASALDARRAAPDLRRLLTQGTRAAVAMTLVISLWLWAFGRQVIELWVGPGHEDALPVLYAFVGVFLVGAFQNPAAVLLKGAGTVRPLAVAVIAEYIANVALTVFLLPRIGVAGAAVGTLVPALVNDLVVIPWLACRRFELPYGDFLARTLTGPVLAGLATLAVVAPLGALLREASVVAVGVGALATAVVFGACYALVGLSGAERRAIGEALLRLRHPERAGASGGDR